MTVPRICIVTTVHPPFDARVFHKQAKTLAQAGYDVTLIAQHRHLDTVDGVKIVNLPYPHNRFQRMFGLSWRAFKGARSQRAAVYHFHDPELIPIGILLKLLSFGRAKVIYDVHENYPRIVMRKDWIPRPLRWPVAVAVNVIERLAACVFDCVVAAEDDIAPHFPQRKVQVVKNYASLPLQREPRDRVELEHSRTVIYAGGLSSDRGVVEMVQAMTLLNRSRKGVRLELLGAFDGPEIEEEVRSLEGFRQVTYHGLIPFEEVATHLESADIGLVVLHPVPGYPESEPIKMFEYMAAGLPVIASNFPMWSKIIEGNQCGLTVEPGNPTQIAEAISYLLVHPDRCKQMGENGRQAVREKYNWNNEARKLLDLYAGLAGSLS